MTPISRFPLNLRFSLGLLLAGFAASTASLRGEARVDVDLSGPGWRLWLDEAATWKDDTLFFPTPPLGQLPTNPPTGGWETLAAAPSLAVAVPGTVEQYLQKTPGPDGDIVGVSWWCRTLDIPRASPPSPAAPRRVLLRFESMRERAEVFVNRRLVGYDVVGSTPVEVDITSAVEPGKPCELAVRITDPAGNFDWRDSRAMRWGGYSLPLSHGFGGITGRVRLIVCDPVYVDDIYVQNTPAITDANVFVTVRNTLTAAARRDVEVRVVERRDPSRDVFRTVVRDVALGVGDTVVPVKLSAPGARRWELDDPRLHVCAVTLREPGASAQNTAGGDSAQRVFGFRWFAPEGFGSDAIFRLNGKRIVLRSAISWGFWPINGIFPTEELAERQIRTAKAMGLNMLNFHRAIGNPIAFEKADELGLLYHEEPGAYKSVTNDAFGRQLAREKLLRMVRRDRSHPSLVVYNLINEWDSRNLNPNPAEIARHREDIHAAHRIDPSRMITHTSAWARGPAIDDPAKLHFRPFDDTPHWSGYYDFHHAGGPAVWNESLYRDPARFHNATTNAAELVFWGEEGAISTPPRLEKIKADLDASPHAGWDGGVYREWFRAFDAFIARKNLRGAFPSVDSLTTAMGAISLGHQGRRIENIRMSNVSDGYAINGWEAQIIENHSGVVDVFRHPKADPAILAYYNQPLYVAVKLRTAVVETSASLVADFFAINEKDLRGPHRLTVVVRDSAGRELTRIERPVTLAGGDTYGQLLAEAVTLPIAGTAPGLLRVEATLGDAQGVERAKGLDQALAVDWRKSVLSGKGAVWEGGNRVRNFLQKEKALSVPAFERGLERLDWVVVARGPAESNAVPVPAERLHTAAQGESGLKATFFSDREFQRAAHQRIDATLSLFVDDGAAPDAALPVMSDYGVRWEGVLTPTKDGPHSFVVTASGAVRLSINGKSVVNAPAGPGPSPKRGTLELKAGVPVSLALEFQQARGQAHCELGWITPEADPTLGAALLERVRDDGTTLVILESAADWMPLLAKAPGSALKEAGSFKVGKAWLGGAHFVREHPLFRDLPVNGAMDWPYQSVVRNGDQRVGLLIEGEQLAAGCYHSFPMQLGTVVGVIPLGRGNVIVSTLDIDGNLGSREGPAAVARKLLCNFIEHAAELGRNGAAK